MSQLPRARIGAGKSVTGGAARRSGGKLGAENRARCVATVEGHSEALQTKAVLMWDEKPRTAQWRFLTDQQCLRSAALTLVSTSAANTKTAEVAGEAHRIAAGQMAGHRVRYDHGHVKDCARQATLRNRAIGTNR